MRTRRVLVGAVALAFVVAGCAGHPDLAADRASTLQDDVLTVTTAAAAGDWDAADAGIAALHVELDAAKESGDVSSARYDRIDGALDRVSSDVETERAKAAAAQAAADQAAAAQAAADQAAARSSSRRPSAPARRRSRTPDRATASRRRASRSSQSGLPALQARTGGEKSGVPAMSRWVPVTGRLLIEEYAPWRP